MGSSTLIKECEVCGVNMHNIDDQIENSEKFITELKSSIRDLVMSTPREIIRDGEHFTWVDFAAISLDDLFQDLESELLQLSNLYLVKSEIEYNPKNVEDNS